MKSIAALRAKLGNLNPFRRKQTTTPPPASGTPRNRGEFVYRSRKKRKPANNPGIRKGKASLYTHVMVKTDKGTTRLPIPVDYTFEGWRLWKELSQAQRRGLLKVAADGPAAQLERPTFGALRRKGLITTEQTLTPRGQVVLGAAAKRRKEPVP